MSEQQINFPQGKGRKSLKLGIRLAFFALALVWSALILQDFRSFITISPEANRDEFAEGMDQALEIAMREYSIAGVAAGAFRDGELIWSARRGLASEAGDPVTSQTAFNLGSVSKPIAVWAVLSLVQSGQIDLDESVENYLTRFSLPESEFDSDAVTVRRLLHHTGGTNNHGYGGYGVHEDQPADIIELSETYEPLGLVREPGLARVYSGGGYVLLQMMIEDVTGQSLDDYVRTRVFEPLGMVASGFEPNELPTRSAAFSYYGHEIEDLRDVAQTAAGAYASGEDIEKFLLAHLDGGGVLSEESLETIFAPTEASENFAMSYVRQETPQGLLFGHGGNNSSWNSQIYFRPDVGDGFYFLTNSTSGAQLDFDLSCAWLSQVYTERMSDRCVEAIDLTHKFSVASMMTGLAVLAIFYWLIAGIALKKRAFKLRPSGRGPLRLTGRMVMFALSVVMFGLSIWMFYTNFLYWRTEVVFMDEMPVDELEYLSAAFVCLLAILSASFWSSPVSRFQKT